MGANTDLHVLLVQEVICDAGLHFDGNERWKIVYGKCEGAWRGNAICYRLHWGEAKACQQAKCIIGLDANEAFHEGNTSQYGDTGRGDTILNVLAELSFRLPPQELHKPSHFPYNQALSPRRLDYIVVKGGRLGPCKVEDLRDLARSDHEPISTTLPAGNPCKPNATTWGARRLRAPPIVQHHLHCTEPGRHTTLYERVRATAKAITEPCTGRTAPYTESPELRTARHQAYSLPPGIERRQAWKCVQKQRKQEHKAWQQSLVEQASRHNWKAMRTLDHLHKTRRWEHCLTDDPEWQRHLQEHMQGVFAKADPTATRTAIGEIHWELTKQCKHTPWRPFTESELRMATATWQPRKSTGPDLISHEALQQMLTTKTWTQSLQEIMDDILYMGQIPPEIAEGITVLLPKTAQPSTWGNTRPITLSSSILKWFAQLLLQRCRGQLTTSTLQWAAPGRQAVELIWVLRRVARLAKDWGEPTYIVKLDIRKAFDSVLQPALGEMVRDKVGGKGGHPWEARAWLGIIEARGLQVAVGDKITPVQQTNGVRQGSPDSPELFASLVGDTLDEATQAAGRAPQHPQCPINGGAFMDDTYLWSNNKLHLQSQLTHLETRLEKKGLSIHPGKTAIITNQTESTTFIIGGQEVAAKGGDTILTVLGSPVSFDNTTAAIAAEMGGRARRAFHMRKPVLCAPTPLKARLQLHDTYIRNTALWGCSTWPAHDALLRQANAIQLGQVRQMMGHRRRPTESWTEWNTRTLRLARLALQYHNVQRWSTHTLHRTWSLAGHIARGEGPTKQIALWKNMQWWRGEQKKRGGARHAKRFNPNLDPERHLATIGGDNWVEVAQDRGEWRRLSTKFVERFDTPWASGRQKAIGNLTPSHSHTPHQRKQQAATELRALRDRA
ncbi:unnamed protein product [Symbiodinium natans]|uniref:Reverse transcriptase domain-containing protein n=1 Tax=Symbiodinium natans TaxID=878477 RepID=A0A812RZI5_9DINO|nr:unnamed protein product [Symbiodinium natans]